MSGATIVSPVGVSMIGKIALPSARAWVNSDQHQREACQFAVTIRMTACERAISR